MNQPTDTLRVANFLSAWRAPQQHALGSSVDEAGRLMALTLILDEPGGGQRKMIIRSNSGPLSVTFEGVTPPTD